MTTAATNEAGDGTRALVFALLALACGHMLSTLLRTIPAVSLDLMAADFRIEPQALASLTSVYHFAFAASQIPVGAAMDRFGVRPVSLSLLAGTVVGAIASGFATGPSSFAFGQLLLGVATSGMLMCPMTLAAKQLSASRFGLWSGAILSIGNIGMLLSSSPLAFVVDNWGWRAGFWISAAGGVAVALAVFALVPHQPAEHKDESSPLSQMIEVLRLGLSRPLRGLIALAMVSLATSLVLRGLWGGPWLMEIKGLSRVEAGNQLGAFTLAMIAGPLLMGMIDRKVGRRRDLVAGTHAAAAVLVALMALGAPHYAVAWLFGVPVMPPQYDLALFVLIGLAISAQPLLFGMCRQLVDAQTAGKALAAVNLAFFLGTALMQSITGAVAAFAGLPAVLLFMAVALIVGVLIFLTYTSQHS
ncbi:MULTISPECIES: MFS transporter [Bradyrhizobium]|uniref:MFS transporter n=1 Tax=Bradyrhizobium TaxID=374 RepID=UPI001BA4A782|nr:MULTISPECIES: MFS transporter [Bradyrhizobium]MBR0926122.1 MFS transporter [Bradyrhizobium diazoefficiens]MCS3761088.1 MFS family permease [Bradyrhizobium centrosematis]MCS3771024.1 MFS family permease [Bradyrhizobium centrosematis]MDT4743263.1 MFS transporter [Bradyrhizobium sp. WYCCWR 12699]